MILRHINHFRACIEAYPMRRADDDNMTNYFAHCYLSDEREAGVHWFMCSSIKSWALASMKIDISTFKTLRKLLLATTKKHVAEKASIFQQEEYQAAMDEMCDENDPTDLVDKVATCLMCCGLHRRSEPLMLQIRDVYLG